MDHCNEKSHTGIWAARSKPSFRLKPSTTHKAAFQNLASTRAGSVSSPCQTWRDAEADGGAGVMAEVIRITPCCS